jgi:DNA-binding transcriptional ArsR family regulator
VPTSSAPCSKLSRVPETRRELVDHVFDALADPTRRRIVEQLGRAPANAGEIADRLPVSRQAVVKHLALLEGAGLVRGERDGRRVVFRLTPGPFTEAAAWMHDVGAAWDRRLDKLARRVTKLR